jgi:hypothetical protein
MSDDNKFNLAEFNKAFVHASKENASKQYNMEKQILEELNKPEPPELPLNRSIGEIIIGIKDSLIGLLDDVLSFNIDSTLFTKNNRLFYFGVLIIIIVIYMLLSDVFSSQNKA